MIQKIALPILKRMKIFKPILEPLAHIECKITKMWASNAHMRLMGIQWGIPPQPEHFDHDIDLFYQWAATKDSFWLERGVFGTLALKGGSVLELACGDGFSAKYFYCLRSEKVIACDFDPKAIKTANRKNKATNIDFVLADIRTDMPKGIFENIIWDAAIEHFTEEEIDNIIKDIKSRLTENGILSGHTIVERQDGRKSLEQHEYEFKNKEDLMRFFTPHFKNVTVFETLCPTRHNLYFWASNGDLPFSDKWESAITNNNK